MCMQCGRGHRGAAQRRPWRTGRPAALLAAALAALVLACGHQPVLPVAEDVSGEAGCEGCGPCEGPGGVCIVPAQAEAWAREVVRLTNEQRAGAGLPPLQVNAKLTAVAERYACRLIEAGFWAHEDPITGSTIATRALDGGYEYRAVGENLAAGQATPADAVAGWMASPGHRRNILDGQNGEGVGFTEIGVAVRFGGVCNVYWVQEFGRPSP